MTGHRIDLEQALADYLAVRRALGYKLARPEKLLRQFLAYLHQHDADTITIDNAVAWATLPAGDAGWWAYRLLAVRGFARHLHSIDAAHQVPPTDLLPSRPHRATPYLYSGTDIAALIGTAATAFRSPLRAATYQALIGLLAVTGLRVGEAIRLDRGDFDHAHGLLTVRDSKFGKSRQVPLHPTTVSALRRYLRRRDRLHPDAVTAAVFISTAGTRLLYCNVQWAFADLVRRVGLKPRSASCRPRIHDLRHTFAVATIIDAYRDGVDVQAHLALLSTYLGHVDPAATYWYLSAAPELLALAGQRLEDHLGSRS